MNSQITRLNSIVLTAAFGLTVSAVQAGQTCAGTSPRVCVERADLSPPDIDFDFSLDFTDTSNPDVTFKTGHSTNAWRVWSQVSATDTTPANLGDLFIDSTSSTDNYKVEIRNPNNDNPGCANLKSAVLRDATSWTGHSALTASEIAGNLTEEVLVVADGSGQGGEVNLNVAGNVSADMILYRVTRLDIVGTASGTMEKKPVGWTV